MATEKNDSIALSVKGISKDFYLPHEKNGGSIKSVIVNMFKQKDKSVDTQHALHDISFEVKKGEFFGIVGRNGSGKSTLLKILAEIYQPTSGTVTRSGKLVPFIELGVGFNPELTGRENVYLNGALLGFSTKEIDEKYDEIVRFAELEDFMDQKLKNYSSGMQVRLAFSVATRAEADILLVDEVLAVGDADFQRKCFTFFKKLKKEKRTVVFVSHDMNAVREYCDRAVLIEKSRIIRKGRVAEVASAYTKMFIQDEASEGDVAEKIDRKRWGNGHIQIQSVRPHSDTITEADKEITITATLSVLHDIEKPVYGVIVKNGVGTEMFGSNSILSHAKIMPIRNGDKLTVTWTCPNILNDGDYTIDFAVTDADTFIEFDWWEDATMFTVVRDEHTAYVVEPPITLDIAHGA